MNAHDLTRRPEDAVVADIDALVTDSLTRGETTLSGYPYCRCGYGWHGLPRHGCPGTDTEGPSLDPAGLSGWNSLRCDTATVESNPLLRAQRAIGAISEFLNQLVSADEGTNQ